MKDWKEKNGKWVVNRSKWKGRSGSLQLDLFQSMFVKRFLSINYHSKPLPLLFTKTHLLVSNPVIPSPLKQTTHYTTIYPFSPSAHPSRFRSLAP